MFQTPVPVAKKAPTTGNGEMLFQLKKKRRHKKKSTDKNKSKDNEKKYKKNKYYCLKYFIKKQKQIGQNIMSKQEKKEIKDLEKLFKLKKTST